MTQQPTLFDTVDPTRGRCPFCRRTVELEPLFDSHNRIRHYRCGTCNAGLMKRTGE